MSTLPQLAKLLHLAELASGIGMEISHQDRKGSKERDLNWGLCGALGAVNPLCDKKWAIVQSMWRGKRDWQL
jgi:hypothetical protein